VWGFVNAAYPMAAHPDQIWVAGVAQRQVSSQAEVGPGSFFYDETANTLWLGTDPTGKEVRASDLNTAMRITSDSSILRGLGIRRYAPSVPDMGTVTVERSNIMIENVALTDNATTGLEIGSGNATNGITLRNLYVANNGMLGIAATYANGITVDQVLSENNNTEHFNTAPVSGGMKIARTRGITVRDSVFRNNDGPGLWLDESSYNATITGNDMRDNSKHGIALEISALATITGNTVVGNGGNGLKINDTSSVTISNNTIDANDDRSVNLVQDTRLPTSADSPGWNPRRAFPDPTMTWLLGPVNVTNNVISNQTGGNCILCVEDGSHKRSAAQMGISANGDTYIRPNPAFPQYFVVWSRGAGDPAVYYSLADFQAATGQEGSSPAAQPVSTTTTTVAPTLPTAPRALSAVAGDTQATLTWVAPNGSDSGPAPVTCYLVTPYVARVAQAPIVLRSRATSAVITGLTNGTSYTFTVAGVNTLGAGTPSVASAAVVIGLPTAPTGVNAIASSGQAVVRWTAHLHDGGQPITGYIVTPYTSVAQPAQTFASSAVSQTITGLTNGALYTFRVVAVNANGSGARSAAMARITVGPATPPGAPVVKSATAGIGQVTLAWSAPVSSGSASITSYIVTPYRAGVAQPDRTYAVSTHQIITGLTRAASYTFRVTAVNAAGKGAPSAASTAVTTK